MPETRGAGTLACLPKVADSTALDHLGARHLDATAAGGLHAHALTLALSLSLSLSLTLTLGPALTLTLTLALALTLTPTLYLGGLHRAAGGRLQER